MVPKKEISENKYPHYQDYIFKSILQKRANGLLKFLNIPYKINKMLISEYTNVGPSISRLDFVGEAERNGSVISLIIECQTNLPTEDDIKRFFQYVSSLRIFKDNNVELFILCTKKASYGKKEFIINEDCIYTMQMISLKDFKAKEIFKNIENKLKNNEAITDEDIASLQLIVFTDYNESELEILLKSRKLIETIAEYSKMDINEKRAIIYLLNVLSVNMLTEDESIKYGEETYMLLNPMDRYCEAKGRKEGKIEGKIEGKMETAKNMLDDGFPIEKVIQITGLSKNDILNAK